MKKLTVILLAVIMALSMAVFAACAGDPVEEPNNPDTPGTEQPADPDQPVTEEQMRAKLAEFKTFLTTEHESYFVSSEMNSHDPEDGDTHLKVSVDVTKAKIRAAFAMTDDEGEYNGDLYYVYDEANALWYYVEYGDGAAEKPELLFVNATDVDYVVDDVIDTRVTTVEDLLSVMDEAAIDNGAFVYTDQYGTMKLSFGDGEYVLEVSMSSEGYGLSLKLTFRSSASDFAVPAAVTEAIGAISPETIAVAKYLNEFEKSSALVTVSKSGEGFVTETQKGFIGGGEYSLYSQDNQHSVITIGGQNVRIEQSGESEPRIENEYSSSDTETIRGMLYAEHIFSFINSYDNDVYFCLKEGSDGKIVALSEEGEQLYAGHAITDLVIDYSTAGKIVMTFKVNVGDDGVENYAVTLTNVGEEVTPDYAPSVVRVKARVFDNVYYIPMEEGGVKYAGAALVFGYDEIIDIKKEITVDDGVYKVTLISPYLLANNYNVTAVVVPDSVTEAYNFADEGIVRKIYYKGSELPKDLNLASSKRLLVYFYSAEKPADKGYYWHYAADNTIEEYDCAEIYTIRFYVEDNDYIDCEVTADGIILDDVPDPYKVGYEFIGWYYDKDTRTNVFDPDELTEVTENLNVYAHFEKTYTVTFETDHGFVSGSGNSYYRIERAPEPQQADSAYTFEGWYYDEDYTQKVEFPLVLDKDTTLYAKWSVAEYAYEAITENGAITGYMLVKYNGNGPDVDIPESYNGKPVVSIGRYCFEGKEEKILSLTINARGDSGNIASAAFKNLTNLVKVTLGENVTDIDGEIAYYKANNAYKEITDDSTFAYCYTIRELRILSTTLKIEMNGKSYKLGGLRRYSIGDEMNVYYNTTDKSKISQDGCFIYRTAGSNNLKWIIKYLPDLAANKESVTIPDDVYGIDDYAFYNCAGIKNVALGQVRYINSNAFEWTGLTEVIIPDSTNTVTDYAFGNCPKLLTVTIGANLKNLTTEAFTGSYNLVEVINRSTKMTITDPSNVGIENALVVKNGETATSSLVCDDNGFATLTVPGEDEDDDTSVYLVAYLVDPADAPASLVIPAGVTHIRDGIFAGYTGLQTVTLPETLLYIGEHAFNQSGLTSVTIPENVLGIGGYAFAETAITELTVLSTKNPTIGIRAFAALTLKKVSVAGMLANVSKEAFGGVFDGYTEKGGCYYLGNTANPYVILVKADNKKNCTLQSGVKQIANYAFKDCELLSTIDIPDSVEYIGAWAFANCFSLYQVKVGSGVTYIGGSAFDACRKLYEVVNASTLTISAGDGNNGGIAANALNVISAGGESILTIEDGVVFMKRTLAVDSSGSSVDTDLYFLIAYDGDGSEVTLPDAVNGQSYRVNEFAFYGRTDVTKITIAKNAIAPEQLRVNGVPLFSLAHSSFWLGNSTSLTIEFKGTEAEWEAISKYDYNDNTGTWCDTTTVTMNYGA
mgnify:CR=1 FL=1